MPRCIVFSVTGCYECLYDRSQDATIARTIGRRMQRSIGRTIGLRPSRLIVHRSLRSLPLVARFHTMALAIDILQSFVIARPRVEIDRDMRPTAARDRSKHCRWVAPWPNRNQSYDPEIVRSDMTVALSLHHVNSNIRPGCQACLTHYSILHLIVPTCLTHAVRQRSCMTYRIQSLFNPVCF